MLSAFSHSKAEVLPVKRMQFGVLSPQEIVRARRGARAAARRAAR